MHRNIAIKSVVMNSSIFKICKLSQQAPLSFNHFSYANRVVHPESGRTLEVYSNQPGVQFYTANYFPKKEECEVGGEKAPGLYI